MSLVSLTKLKGTSKESMKDAISESLKLLDYSFEKEISKVVIKANLCYYWDHTTGQTTNPLFVEALVELLREKTSASEIAIIESDASAMKCKYAYNFLGYGKVFKDTGVKLVNLSEEASKPVVVSCNGLSYRFQVPEIIQNADLRINLPKIKYTMKGIELTCALKNIYGCNPFPQKFKYHPRLGQIIVALNKAMKFDLCIIDSNIVSGIQPRKMGLLMASQDLVAIDVAAAKIAGLNLKKIKYLKLASDEGLGSLNYILKGEDLNQFRIMYPRKTIKKKLMSHAYVWVNRLGLSKRLGLA
jgi:uncharacterized protein (DUF362 family)